MGTLKVKNISAVVGLVLLGGCVSTSTVSTKQLGDKDLSCESLATRIGEVQSAQAYAKSKKGASGENVAAVLFFWPALLVNSSNTTEMIRSMSERETTLVELYQAKECNDDIPSYTNEEMNEKLKNNDTVETFN